MAHEGGKMTKSERLFSVLAEIAKHPDRVKAADLAKMFDISERGVYRYLSTLVKAGVLIRAKQGKYRLSPDWIPRSTLCKWLQDRLNDSMSEQRQARSGEQEQTPQWHRVKYVVESGMARSMGAVFGFEVTVVDGGHVDVTPK